jgi:predicted GTPase
MQIAQLGIASVAFIVPLLFPAYFKYFSLKSRFIIAGVIFFVFNTQNFSFSLIVPVLTLYGLGRHGGESRTAPHVGRGCQPMFITK